ncbi:MAG TPA: F0F1 ATP synthase subunit A [Candidatus Paceibacterota bacterium]|nr:F0F1 ATP synthase subunit A [Candidatus Paceibacterota bacterium]
MQNISLRAETIFHIGNFPITNSLLLSAITLIFLSALAIAMRNRMSEVPGKIQNVVEIIIEGILDLMDSVLGSRKSSEKYFPIVSTIFLFVLFSNWLGLLPGVGSVVVREGSETVPLLRSPASDLNFTLAIALIAMTFVNAFATVAVGLKGRLSVFFNFTGPIGFFTGGLELISEFAKIISFSFRLFGNVFAGEVLLAIMAFLVPYAAPVPFLGLEVFVGFIQAFIFGMLTLVFISAAISSHDEEKHETKSAKPEIGITGKVEKIHS